jgi:phosphoribosylaminoimidazolecarboxamide formyltransferase/IMP cyclohydrolase
MSDVRPVRRALLAVYDKSGVVELARALVEQRVALVSSGGTAQTLRDAGIPVTPVEEVTGSPEMLDGRVKTLHPRIHAGILADRRKPDHEAQLAEHGIEPFDLVVVNLYPFRETVASGAGPRTWSGRSTSAAHDGAGGREELRVDRRRREPGPVRHRAGGDPARGRPQP